MTAKTPFYRSFSRLFIVSALSHHTDGGNHICADCLSAPLQFPYYIWLCADDFAGSFRCPQNPASAPLGRKPLRAAPPPARPFTKHLANLHNLWYTT